MSLDEMFDKDRKKETVVTGISMPSDVFDQLNQITEHYGASRSAVVAALVGLEYAALTKAGKLAGMLE